jgi:hypothetical protein
MGQLLPWQMIFLNYGESKSAGFPSRGQHQHP